MIIVRVLPLFVRALCLAAALLMPGVSLQAVPVRTVKVAVFPFPPAIFVDEADGAVKGFYVDMLREVASRERWELEFVQGTWAEGLERARKGEVDLLTSVAFTPERATFLDYGKETSFTVWSLVYAHPRADIQSILDLKDRSVGVMRNDANGAHFRALATQFAIPITFLEFGTFVDVMKAVESRQVDAGVTPNSFGYFSEHNYRVVRTPVVVNPFPIYFAVGKGKNTDLLSALDRFLAENRGTPQSRQAQIVDRWLNHSHGGIISPWVMRGFLLALALLGLSLGAVVVFRRQVRRATGEIRDLNHDLRRELEARLASEENLAITLHSIGDAVIATDTEGLITRMNTTAERLTGWPLAEALGRPLTEVFRILNALTREPSEDPVKKVLAFGEVVGLANHTVLLARDGQEYQIADSAAPIRDAGGVIGGVVLVFSDVTEQYRVAETLRESEERWKFAIEGAGDGLWDWNLQSGKAFFSPRYKSMLGFAEEEIGDSADEWSKRIHPEDAPGVMAALQPYMEGKSGAAEVEFRMQCKDGSWLWILGRGLVVQRDEDGKPLRMIGTNRDITPRKLAADALAEQKRIVELILEQSLAGYWDWLIQENEEYLSPTFKKMFGYEDHEMPNSPEAWQKIIFAEDLPGVFEVFQRHVESRGAIPYYSEVRYQHKDGSTVWVICTGRVIEWDEQGRPVRMIGCHINVTPFKLAEEEKLKLQTQLQKSQKMESLGTLAGGVAHDMNNVLGAILGLASAHISNQPTGSPLHQALDTIIKATERGGKMVKSLLGFARQSPVENHKLDMNAILREQVSLLERTTLAKVSLQMDLEAELRPILGDASALTHAFMNLCVNAVDAMPANGTLILHTRNIDSDWVEVMVEDNGVGMPKEVLEKAMEPFFTTKETGKGTGLGLSMVFSTVKAHGGQMAIESEPGQGTRVMLRFPACEQETPVHVEPTMAESNVTPQGALKVLLIDDDELIRGSVQMILEVLGHSAVKTAQSGEEALAILEAGLEVNLVILDMNMPGLGGIGTLPRLRALRPEVPVLLATGRVDQTALTLASAHPGVTLLSKPFGLRELQKHLVNIGLG